MEIMDSMDDFQIADQCCYDPTETANSPATTTEPNSQADGPMVDLNGYILQASEPDFHGRHVHDWSLT